MIHISRHSTACLLVFAHILDGTAMDCSVFIHLTQLPSNPIIFGFGQLALRCDFTKTKIQPLTGSVYFTKAVQGHLTYFFVISLTMSHSLKNMIRS